MAKGSSDFIINWIFYAASKTKCQELTLSRTKTTTTTTNRQLREMKNGGVWRMANENSNAVMNRNISSELKCNQGLRIQCTWHQCGRDHSSLAADRQMQPAASPSAASAAARLALLGGTGVVTAATVIRLDFKTVVASTTAASAAATESVDCIPYSLLLRICNWAFRKLIQFMLILWQIANEKWRRLPPAMPQWKCLRLEDNCPIKVAGKNTRLMPKKQWQTAWGSFRCSYWWA